MNTDGSESHVHVPLLSLSIAPVPFLAFTNKRQSKQMNKNILSDYGLSEFCFPELKLNFGRFQLMKTCQPVSYTRSKMKCRRFDNKSGVRDARTKLKEFVKV